MINTYLQLPDQLVRISSMNCDEFFDKLTSSADHVDADVREHIAACPRCRDLQEALFPSLNLIRVRQSGTDEQSWESDNSLSAVESAFDAAERLRMRVRSEWRSSDSSHSLRRYIASFLAGAAVSLLCIIAIQPQQRLAAPIPSATVCLWQHQEHASDGVASNHIVLACVECHLQSASHVTQLDL